ncbi:hypothetical protein BS78_08G041200 [Paspalum vaginatum]|nr:hypothetical protein BS78_08G041200 [Paspalum vaginatum]
MEQWLVIQSFFHGLNRSAQEHLDAAARGSFLSQSVRATKDLIEKIATNQGWKEERSSTRSHGVHHIDITDMLATKMDMLLKKLEDSPETALVQALDARITSEVYENTGHSGNSCPETRPEDANFVGNSSNLDNGSRPQPGWNSRPYIPFSGQGNSSSNSQQFNKPSSFDQRAMNDSISKKFHANDRLFESISLQIETLNSAMKNQLSFNKMLETQIAQLAASLPNANVGAKYSKNILNNKKPLPLAEIVHMTEECSATILN